MEYRLLLRKLSKVSGMLQSMADQEAARERAQDEHDQVLRWAAEHARRRKEANNGKKEGR